MDISKLKLFPEDFSEKAICEICNGPYHWHPCCDDFCGLSDYILICSKCEVPIRCVYDKYFGDYLYSICHCSKFNLNTDDKIDYYEHNGEITLYYFDRADLKKLNEKLAFLKGD